MSETEETIFRDLWHAHCGFSIFWCPNDHHIARQIVPLLTAARKKYSPAYRFYEYIPQCIFDRLYPQCTNESPQCIAASRVLYPHTMPVIAPLLIAAANWVISTPKVHLPIWSLICNDTKIAKCIDKLSWQYSPQNGFSNFLPGLFSPLCTLGQVIDFFFKNVKTIVA